MFRYIFTWIKYYKYFYLDFSVELLTKVCATGLEPKGASRFLRCWKCHVLWDCRYDLRIATNGTGACFCQCRRPKLTIQAEAYLLWLHFVILSSGTCALLMDSYTKLNTFEWGHRHVTFN